MRLVVLVAPVRNLKLFTDDMLGPITLVLLTAFRSTWYPGRGGK
jgi:hypothetical protein